MVSMPTLRLTQTDAGKDVHNVEIALEVDGLARQTAKVQFPFRFSDADQRDLRWYLEDYLKFPQEPNPKSAARIEGMDRRAARSARPVLRARSAQPGRSAFTAGVRGRHSSAHFPRLLPAPRPRPRPLPFGLRAGHEEPP
jgi:hypothetical protein